MSNGLRKELSRGVKKKTLVALQTLHQTLTHSNSLVRKLLTTNHQLQDNKLIQVMATVSLKLFGRSPNFLNLKTSTSLFQLISTLPKLGCGLKVTPTDWYKAGRDDYYTITRVSPPTSIRTTGRVYGIKNYRGADGKEVLMPTYNFKYWHIRE
jgi:Mitochondrial 28S ribosomal protein S34